MRILGVDESDLSPPIHRDGARTWVYPVMDKVIEGIERGDLACVAIGVDFVEEDQGFPFGALLKSGTARALRRAYARGELTREQCERLRTRIVAMLVHGNTPHEFFQYAKLLRHLGLGKVRIEDIERRAPSEPTWSTRRYLNYVKRFVR